MPIPFLLASSHGDDAATMVFAVPIVAILCTFAWLIVKAIMAPFAGSQDPTTGKGGKFRRWRNGPRGGVFPDAPTSGGGFTEEEFALLQKLTQTLALMERRVESLETILIDQTRSKEKYGTKL